MLLVLGFLSLVALYGLKEYFRTNKDLLDEKPVAELRAPALIEAFATNPAQSNHWYRNKVVAVLGNVRSVQQEGNPVVDSLGDAGQMSSVQCSMNSAHVEAYKTVAVGQQIKLKGLCTGAITDDLLGTDIKLSRCIVES